MSAFVAQLAVCEGSNHTTGTQGHTRGARAAYRVWTACPACTWNVRVNLCAGRVDSITAGSYTMTCPECGATTPWEDFWREIAPLDDQASIPAEAPHVSATPSVVEIIAAYAEYLESRRRAAGTIRQRTRHVRLLAATTPDLRTITPETLDLWVRSQSADKKPETVKSLINSLRSFYKWADRFGVIRPNPTVLLEYVPNPHRMGRTVTDDELRVHLEKATPQLRAMLLLGREAGLRLTEITTLHTDSDSGLWLTIIGKGSKQRRVPVTPPLREALDAIRPSGSGYYFPGQRAPYMHPMSVNKIITRETGLNPHALRHAAGTAVYAATKDLRATQDFLGHSSPNTTAIYVHMSEDALRNAASAGSIMEPRA